MMQTKKFILTSSKKNSNKFWNISLDGDSVSTYFGRVGKNAQTKNYGPRGEYLFNKKIREKLKKGYVECKLVSNVESKPTGDLENLAISQICNNNPKLEALIRRLVKENIHAITANTNITYNEYTGLFSTPLGIVTQEGIDSARQLLVEIINNKEEKDKEARRENFRKMVDRYLMLIPQDVGMKYDPEKLFPDIESVRKQNDILDSLESSLQKFNAGDYEKQNRDDFKQEKVFDVSFDFLEDEAERRRIEKKYVDTRKDIHVCSHLKVKEIYKLEIRGAKSKFLEKVKLINNTRELWHGSRVSNILSIMKKGLIIPPANASYCCGRAYGNGVYFAIDSSKSLNYSFGFWSGGSKDSNCFMFLADVAMGKSFTPKTSGWGNFGGGYPKAGFDSTWAKGGESGVMNDEIIVYDTDQCDLKYLVEFQ